MNPPHEVYDDAYGCKRINGILAPIPIDSHAPTSKSEDPSRRRRPLLASEVVETKEIAITALYHCQRTLRYILHIQEVVTGNKSAYILEPFEHSSGNRRVKVKKTKANAQTLAPVNQLQEIFPDNEGVSELSINQRLEGKWRKEIRRRTTSAVKETFYYHEKIRGAMRAIGEVATFIICNGIY